MLGETVTGTADAIVALLKDVASFLEKQPHTQDIPASNKTARKKGQR